MDGKVTGRAAFERRAEYFRLRREGVKKWNAASRLKLGPETTSRYERWFKAIQAGQIAEPQWPGESDDRRREGEEG